MFGLLGFIAGAVSGISHIPYLIDMVKQKTKPERASWLIWSVLGSIAFFSQLAEGATDSLWLTAIDTTGVVLTFILAVKYGVGGLSKRDITALTAAGIGLILWYFTSQAVLALVITILIDMSGAVLTVVKTYEDPGSETLITWWGVAVAGLLSTISVGKFDLVLMMYPFYIFLANFAVVIAIYTGRAKKR